MGDSITRGSGDGFIGYREPLRNELLARSSDVDFIGTLRSGRMEDNDHEGHSGQVIADITPYAAKSIKARPNIVLIHAGTNNMDPVITRDRTASAVPDLRRLIQVCADGAPDASIFVAQLVFSSNVTIQNNMDELNAEIPGIVADFPSARLVDMREVDELWDDKHPGHEGYQHMADIWLAAIDDARAAGVLREPGEPEDGIMDVGLAPPPALRVDPDPDPESPSDPETSSDPESPSRVCFS